MRWFYFLLILYSSVVMSVVVCVCVFFSWVFVYGCLSGEIKISIKQEGTKSLFSVISYTSMITQPEIAAKKCSIVSTGRSTRTAAYQLADLESSHSSHQHTDNQQEYSTSQRSKHRDIQTLPWGIATEGRTRISRSCNAWNSCTRNILCQQNNIEPLSTKT